MVLVGAAICQRLRCIRRQAAVINRP